MKVIIIPKNHDYIKKLTDEMKKEDVDVRLFNSFHYSTPANFIKTLLYRFRGYKLIHIHWLFVFPFNFLMRLYVKFSKLLGYKIVWTVHNVHAHEESKKKKEKTKWFVKHVDYFFINYASNLLNLEEYLGFNIDKSKVKIIYHPSFEDVYPNTISKEDARNKLGIPLDKKVSLCFGQMRRYKGVDIFQESLKRLGDEYYGLIVGEVKDKGLFKELETASTGKSNIMLVPERVPNKEIQLYLNACDVVVAPYRDITTSGVALLSYAFSRPFISTNKGCIPEVIKEGKTGFIVKENNPENIAKTIKKIFTKDYEKMGNNAYMLSKEFSWRGLGKKTVEGYGEVTQIKKQ